MAEQGVQTLLFPKLFDKPLVATFDTPQQSSDGGAILLKAIDERAGVRVGALHVPNGPAEEGRVGEQLAVLSEVPVAGLGHLVDVEI